MAMADADSRTATRLQRIAAGTVYQVNLCRVLTHDLAEDADVPGLAALLQGEHPAPYEATIHAPEAGLDTIRLLDEPDEILYAFKRAVTDSGREIRFSNDPEKAGVNNLLGIYQAVTGKDNAAAKSASTAALSLPVTAW